MKDTLEHRSVKGGSWTICIVEPVHPRSRMSEERRRCLVNLGFHTFLHPRRVLP